MDLPTPPQPSAPRRGWPLRYYAFGVLALALLVCFGYLAVAGLFTARQAAPGGPVANLPGPYPYGGQQQYNGPYSAPTTTEPEGDELPIPPESSLGQLNVDWYPWPAEVRSDELLPYDEQTMAVLLRGLAVSWGDPLPAGTMDRYRSSYSISAVGRVRGGRYDDATVYHVNFTPEGPAFQLPVYVLVKTPSSTVVAGRYSDDYLDDVQKQLWSVDETLTLSGMEPPAEISIPNSTLKLRRGSELGRDLFTKLVNPGRAFEYQPGKYVYRYEPWGCFVVIGNDGAAYRYYIDLPFFRPAGDVGNGTFNRPAATLDATWSDGTRNADEYRSEKLTGCGSSGCYSYASYITTPSVLREAGRASNGDAIYELSDTSVKQDARDERSVLQQRYDWYYPGPEQEKVSFEQFLADHPLVFWRDPFGQYIEFSSTRYAPAVECGKPVIYLYPTEPTDVNVKVRPGGGFTVTEPAYPDGGWNVRAEPSGKLTSYDDGRAYPYLFWEGYGLNYQPPAEGTVVARAEVESFLRRALLQLGLQPAEYEEFISFWLPRMQAKPYYFISFVPQADFDRLAPLTVTPQPDTVIRVFMDYVGLERPIEVPAQRLSAPARRGFTVVEWGGALRRE